MKIFFRLFILMGLMLTSCQDVSSDVSEGLTPSMEMAFNFTGPNVQTKVSDGAFEYEDEIGVYVTDYSYDGTPIPLQVSGNRANNLKVRFVDDVWQPDYTVYWGTGKSDVYAYYPFWPEISDVGEHVWEVATDQTERGFEMSDVLWAKATGVSYQDGTVNLTMRHLMSKVTVKLVAGEEFIGSLPQDAEAFVHSTVTRANVDLETGVVVTDPHSGSSAIKMRKLGLRTYDGVPAVVFEAVVIPQLLESIVPLFEINDKSVSYMIEDYFNFRPGVSYVYTVTLNSSTSEIKVEIGCELEDWNNPSGGDSGEDGGSGEEGDPSEVEYIDLSAEGSANCYLVDCAGDYMFKAVIGNSEATVGNVKNVEVLWESFGTEEKPDAGDIIASVSYKNGYVRFSTPENFRNGNAVIAVRNSKGVILWSWHIWCAEEGWKEQVYYNDAGVMMDRNLGATSATPGEVGALGLIYQWGRKDPFLASASIMSLTPVASTGVWQESGGGSVIEAEKNPMTWYSSLYVSNAWSSVKTLNDPCPIGWRVPEGGEEGVWVKAFGTSSSFFMQYDTVNRGINFAGALGDDEVIWYPAMGYLNENTNGGLYEAGKTGYYHASYYGINFNEHVRESVWPLDNTTDMTLPVRCQKE